ncbi:MAG TPA: M56 family metallopeptidase, partial [Longimicrobiaceae bacterium]|nr:M56 family metallopeptidase [Longimicrobiaceae bacterium]
MPMTWGVRRPVVLLPDEAGEWPEERRRVVLLHELAHVARYDCLTQTLAAVACALYWFHPGAWYAARRLRVERELACDDRVLSAGTRAREYAGHLLEVARAFRPVGMAAPVSVSMARPSQLEGRLLAVLDGLRSRSTLSRSAALGAAAGALVLVLPLAAMRPGEARVGAAAAVAGKPAPQDPVTTFLAPPAQDGAFEREFTARPGERITLDLQAHADVTVEAWDRATVLVRSQLYGPRDLRVEAERRGGEVRVHTRLLRREGVRGELKMTVRVPRRFDVDVFTQGGGVDVRGVTGTFTGTTQGGGLSFTDARGTVRMTTEGGGASITDSELRGVLRTEGGGTVLSGNRGDLDIRSEGGPTIHTSREGTNTITTTSTHDYTYDEGSGVGCAPPCTSVSRAGGQVVLPSAPGGASVSTGGGQIRIGPAGGNVRANTGGGAITLESVDGSVRATTGSGAVNARLVGDGGDVEITTGSGTVTLTLPAGFSGDLEVESAYTERHGPTQVISDFPLSVTHTESWDGGRGTPRRYVRGRGRLGSGRHTVRIATVNGNVHILRAGSRRATSTASTTRTASTTSTASASTTSSEDVDCERDCTITINPSGGVTGVGYTSSVSTVGVGVGVGEGVSTGGGEGYAYAVGDEAGRALAVRRMVENAPPAAAAQGAGRLAFSDPSLRVQKAAVAALARLPEDHASPQLTRIARDHPSAEVRRAA